MHCYQLFPLDALKSTTARNDLSTQVQLCCMTLLYTSMYPPAESLLVNLRYSFISTAISSLPVFITSNLEVNKYIYNILSYIMAILVW